MVKLPLDCHLEFHESFLTETESAAIFEWITSNYDDHSDEYPIDLPNGSLLLMGDGCQERYEHSLPLDPGCTAPRINLTFRPFDWPTGFKRGPR